MGDEDAGDLEKPGLYKEGGTKEYEEMSMGSGSHKRMQNHVEKNIEGEGPLLNHLQM